MDSRDRDLLIRMSEDLKFLRGSYEEDIPAMRQEIQKNTSDIIILKRDKWWALGVATLAWGAFIAFFDGFWEHFKK